MNKVVCNICGTSYPENATQCPICGFARSADILNATNTENEKEYQYVKGGRFSKANVKKRNNVRQKTTEKDTLVVENNNVKKEKGNGFMIVIVIILLLAIIAVVSYIALRFFLPNNYIFEGLDNLKIPSFSQQIDNEMSEDFNDVQEDSVDDTTPVIKTVNIDRDSIEFEEIGSTCALIVDVTPADLDDVIYFDSSDEAVATVDDDGIVTAVGEGSAVITVTCGTASAECTVSCTIPADEPEFTLNRKEITFDEEGQSWVIYDGSIPVSEITWSSDNNDVATIIEGKVVAVGNGDTTVYGTYGSQSVSCLIHCKFEDSTGDTGSVSEAGNDSETYSLYNPTGLSEDVTLKVGEQFTLKLVDEDKKEVADAQWSVEDASICSYSDSTVKALKSGTTKVTATYRGKTYISIVRVK